MKRTKHIHHAAFRKSWQVRHLTPIAVVVSSFFVLTGCEQSDQTVALYQNADDCRQAHPGQQQQCSATYDKARQEAERTAPKYASYDDCTAEFGANQCQPVSSSSANAETTHNGQLWMPLMAGYMMGRLMSNGLYQQQPLFSSRNPTSPAYGKFVDAGGKSYGMATGGRTLSVPSSAFTPKASTSKTVTRNGFGNSVARQATMQRSTATGSGRTMGG